MVVKRIFKVFVLVVALLLPVLIYLFLKGFGENHFAVPVFYTDGLSLEGCELKKDRPHLVEFESYEWQKAHLFYFPQWVNDEEFYRQCGRIQAKWPTIQFTAIADSSYQNSKIGNKLIVSDKSHLFDVANCALVLGQDSIIHSPIYNQLVLVDVHKQIRGYYTGSELKDMDRLDIELDIINREENSL